MNIDLLPDAVAAVPHLQQFAVNGQQVIGTIALPVCLNCRKNQLGSPLATGRLLVGG